MSDPEEIIRAEVSPVERLLWAGGARTGFLLQPGDWFLIPFSLLWCGLVVVGLVNVIHEGGPQVWGGVAILAIFLFIGLYILVGRYVWDARRRVRTAYGLSNERVIIVSGTARRLVRSLPLDTLQDVILSERADGSGTILFGPLSPWRGWCGGQGWNGGWPAPLAILELAGETRRVYELILDARRALKSGV